MRNFSSLSQLLLAPPFLAVVFLAGCLSVLAGFILQHPLDWQQPETLRMRYHLLQSGVSDGPLSSRILPSDLLKPLGNKARGGGYEARYAAKFLDGFISKFYQSVYRLTGPFLGEPFILLLILITALFLILAAYEWFESLPAALISTGFWLVSSQTLLDSRYPIRPNMALAVVFSVYILWELLRLRRKREATGSLIRMSVAFFLALTSHESSFFILLPCLVIIASQRKLFRPHLKSLIASAVGTVAVYALFFFIVLPYLMKHLIGEEPLTRWLQDDSPLDLCRPEFLLERLKNYTCFGLWYYVRENWGWSLTVPRWGWLLSGGGIILTASVLLKYWRSGIVPLLTALAFCLPVTLLMFPYVPSAIDTPVYYYALIVVWFVFPLAGLLARLSPAGRSQPWITVILGLSLIAAVNFYHSTLVMEEMPGAFGYNREMRDNVRDVLALDRYARVREIPLPFYTTYPRPRHFDISNKWDIMLRVWHGEPERVFAMMVPVLYLRHYEAGLFLGDPAEFEAWQEVNEAAYEKSALALADLPQKGWYDLSAIREGLIPPKEPPLWRSVSGGGKPSFRGESLIGRVDRVTLSPGEWRTRVLFPSKPVAPSLVLFLIRADLQADGSDEVWYRVQPLPEKQCGIEITGGGVSFRQEHVYGWNYQLYTVGLEGMGDKPELNFKVITGGEAEVVGPIMIPADRLIFKQWPHLFTGGGGET